MSYAVNLSSAFSTFTPRDPLNRTASPGRATWRARPPAPAGSSQNSPSPPASRAAARGGPRAGLGRFFEDLRLDACLTRGLHHGAGGPADANQQIHTSAVG